VTGPEQREGRTMRSPDFRPFKDDPNELVLTCAALHNAREANEGLREEVARLRAEAK
jgi:hypothetical protein